MKKIKLIPLTILALVLAISCSVDDNPQQLESDFSNLPYVVGFDRTSDSYVFLPSDVNPVNASVSIQLGSGPGGLYSSQDTTVSYEIDTANSNAIIGSEFEILNTSNTFTIPAGREISSETLDYTIFPSNLPFDEQKNVKINLISQTNGVVTGQQIGTIDIIFERCDPPLVGTYTAANTVNGSSNGDGETVNITALECNVYRASNLPNFNGVFTWDFILNSDNTITLTGTLDTFSNMVTGNGVLLSDGTIQINDFDLEDNAQDMSFDLIPN
ncbi:hypothetical protein [Olleya sp. YS]|uniref:hypothetical protein n=1 Tax=Olleya sp. YS TaxID=3028318 RepID=UPI0024342CB6|nr:hypothetical protein [Olleya sp. YS]WGD33767.1 hypothetical protein Ollyesu_08240 [Olleya sp. YS]